MSILSFPRINFKGAFTTNPCTANNDDVMPAIVNRDSDTFGTDITSAMTDDQVRSYLREQVTMGYPNQSQCFPFIRSGWNLYGDYTTTFDNAMVTSVVTGPGQAITQPTEDALIGQPVELLGSVSSDPMRRGTAMLCDLDPTGLVTTQLWIGGLQFGVTGYDSGTSPGPSIATVTFDHDTRGFQNWLNFFSTFGSYGGEQNFVGIGCMMQFAIPASAIPAQVSLQSPALRTFLTAARAAAGIVVRFRIWEVEPQIINANLYASFSQGQAVDNPAVGYMVGTVGVWEQGEPESETAGRKLTCPYPRPAMKFQPPGTQPAQAQTWPPQQTPWTQGLPPALIGNAVARVQPTQPVISLDLVSSFPKFGFRNPNGPQKPDSQGFNAPTNKMNFGAVELAVIPSGGGAPQTIGPVDYGLANYHTYDNFGGIVDIPFNPSLAQTIKTGTLILQGSTGSINAGTPLLQEQTLRLVTDDRAVYWYPPQENPKNTIRLKVYDRGGPTSQPTTVYLYEYFNIIQPQPPSTCVDGVRPNQTVQQDTRGLLQFPATITIPAGQGYSNWFDVPVSVAQSGATLLAFQTEADKVRYGTGNNPPVTGVPVWSYATYSSVRVFTDDDFSKLYQNLPLKWDDVYNYVLRFYYLIYPAMSRFIPLNLEDSIVGQATLIQQRLNTPQEPTFWTTYNMPVTRSMSPNKVKLVLDFIAQQQKAQQGT